MKINPNQIKIAIPNKGRLREPAISLLKKSGYKFRTKERALYATCTNSDLVVIFTRADDIPVLVDKGAVDLGITGQDLIEEREATVSNLLDLGFGRCKLCLAIPENQDLKSLKVLEGKTIATSFPTITKNYFSKQNIKVQTVELNGSVEIMVALEFADVIVDLVESGDTLKQNKLKSFETIGTYQSVLIANPNKENDPEIQKLKRRFEGILVASRYSILEYNIPKAKITDAENITPGFKSPTIASLEDDKWLAVKVMVEKSIVVDVMDKLEALGATAIFETAIDNCRL